VNKTALLEEFWSALELGNQNLLALSEERATTPKALGKWSPKQILGHLIDSAFNNHQRFVRAQIVAHLKDDVLELDGYAQDEWVRVGNYNTRSNAELIGLWTAINQQIAHIIRQTPEVGLGTTIKIGGGEPVTLGFLMLDYVQHMKHHLGQLDFHNEVLT
jgi:hypothetical protein